MVSMLSSHLINLMLFAGSVSANKFFAGSVSANESPAATSIGFDVDVHTAVDTLQAYEDLVVAAQERDDDRLTRATSELLNFQTLMAEHIANASSAISSLVVLRTEAVARGLPSPDLRAAMVAEQDAEAEVKRLYEECRLAASDVEAQLALHAGRVSALDRTRASISRPPVKRGTHVAEYNDRVLLVQEDAASTAATSSPSSSDHSIVGKLLARMLESSSTATAKLQKQREAILQPCEERLEAAQIRQREARAAREELAIKRVNVTGALEGIDESLEVLRKAKAQGAQYVDVLRKHEDDMDVGHRQRTEGRDAEETAVETLSLHYDKVLDVRKRERLAKMRAERDAASNRFKQLVTELNLKIDQCDTEMDELEASLERVERMAEVLEEIVTLVKSQSKKNGATNEPQASLAIPAVLAALSAGDKSDDGLFMSLIQDEASAETPIAAAVVKLRTFTDKRIEEARKNLMDRRDTCNLAILDLVFQVSESFVRLNSIS